MTANQTEVMTEDATIKAMVDRFLTWKLPKSFSPDGGIDFNPSNIHSDSWPIGTNLFTATEARQMLEHVLGDTLTSLRSSRDEADDSIRKFFKELNPDIGGPEKDCVQTLIAFAREWHRRWKAEEAKVARLEGERDKAVKERNEWREACQQNAEAIDLIHGAFQSEVPAWDGEKYSSYAEWGVRAGKRALELIAERDAARAEVSRLSGELASRPAKELVEAESMMVKHLRKLLGGPGTDSIDLRPSRLRAAEQLVAMSSTLKHTQALSDCCHCLVKVGGLWLKELVEGIDSALSQASSADALSAPAKEGVVLLDRKSWIAAVREDMPRKKAYYFEGMWKRDNNTCQQILNCELSNEQPQGYRRLSDSEAAAFLAEHPLPKDAFSPAPVAAPASAVSPASEEKDTKAQVGGIPSGTGVVAAPSEDYPGVRVWRDCDGDIWIANDSGVWVHFQKRDEVCKQTSSNNITEAIQSLNEFFQPFVELHGPERLAVIEKAKRIDPNLFGAPGAAKKESAVDKAREKLERQIRVWSSGSADFMARHIESFIDAKFAALKGGANV